MKEIFGWLRWMFSGLQFWQWAFISSSLLNVFSIFMPNPWSTWAFVIGISVIFGFMLKWFFVDSLIASWTKYKQHRNELLTTIKTSDER